MCMPAPGCSRLPTHEADEQRDGRDHLEIDQRAEADDADAAHVAHLGDADDDGGEDDHRHDGADEGDEGVAERLHVDAEGRVRTAPTTMPRAIADQHLDVELLRASVAGRARSPRAKVLGLRVAPCPLRPAQF